MEATMECWTCGKHQKFLHKEWRDALNEYELTCDECHKEEYPEQYEEAEAKNEFKADFCVMNNTYFRGQIFKYLGLPITTQKKKNFNKVLSLVGYFDKYKVSHQQVEEECEEEGEYIFNILFDRLKNFLTHKSCDRFLSHGLRMGDPDLKWKSEFYGELEDNWKANINIQNGEDPNDADVFWLPREAWGNRQKFQ
jgi:hypothetical protein